MSNPYQSFGTWAGQQFGINPDVLSNIAKYESSFNPGVQNNWDSNASAGTPSYGLMQFIQPTFNSFYDSALKERPKLLASLGEKNWKDWRQQMFVTAYALKSGAGSHWATYNRALQEAGGNLYGPAVHGGPMPGGGLTGPSAVTYGSMPPVQGAAFDPVRAAKFQIGFQDEPELANAYINNMQADAAAYENSMNRRNAYSQQAGAPGVQIGGGDYKGGKFGSWEDIWKAGERFGMVKPQGAQGYRPGGTTLHGQGLAADFGDASSTPWQLKNYANWLRENAASLGINELFYDPLGWYIDDGQLHEGQFGDHGDHLHVGVYG